MNLVRAGTLGGPIDGRRAWPRFLGSQDFRIFESAASNSDHIGTRQNAGRDPAMYGHPALAVPAAEIGDAEEPLAVVACDGLVCSCL